jgi:hypothetical protein
MKRNYQILLTSLMLMASTGCSDKDAQQPNISAVEEAELSVQAQAGSAEAAKQLAQIAKKRAAAPQNEEISTPDNRDNWRWSAKDVSAHIKRAKSGDIDAADRLHQYYTAHEDKAQMAYWEEWLIKRGDKGAMQTRLYRLYSASSNRSSVDPRKLIELKEAERLQRSVTADQADKEFLDRLRSEIAAIEALR